MKKYYVYIHINKVTGLPFYIGKGEGYRSRRKSGRSKDWYNIVNEYGYKINILESFLSEVESIQMEKYYINLYGRLDNKTGILINKTSGGNYGTSGRVVTEDQRARISSTLKMKYKNGLLIQNKKDKIKGLGRGTNSPYKGRFRLSDGDISDIKTISDYKVACDKYKICPATYYKVIKYNNI